jgi:hypothetical protein
MTWTIGSYLFDTIEAALAEEPRAQATPAGELALVLVTLGIRVAEVAKLAGGSQRVIVSCLPGLQPDEKKAIAAVREAYASARRVKQRKSAGTN